NGNVAQQGCSQRPSPQRAATVEPPPGPPAQQAKTTRSTTGPLHEAFDWIAGPTIETASADGHANGAVSVALVECYATTAARGVLGRGHSILRRMLFVVSATRTLGLVEGVGREVRATVGNAAP